VSFKNFLAASSKRNMVGFGLFPATRDLTWIADNDPLEAVATVAYSSSPTFDLANGLSQYITLTGNVFSSQFVINGGLSIPEGTRFFLHVTQDGTGGWEFNLPSTVRNRNAQLVGTTANTRTTLGFEYYNSGWDFFTPPLEGPTS